MHICIGYHDFETGKSLSFSSLSLAGARCLLCFFFARAHARVCLCECVCFVVLSPTHFIHSCCTVVLLNFQWNSTMCCKHVKWTQVRVKDRCRRINRLVHTLLGILERTKDNRPKKNCSELLQKGLHWWCWWCRRRWWSSSSTDLHVAPHRREYRIKETLRFYRDHSTICNIYTYTYMNCHSLFSHISWRAFFFSKCK